MSNIKWINLTPHIIRLCRGQKVVKTFWPCGIVARVKTNVKLVDTIDNIPIYQRTNSKTIYLPRPKANTVYIVSSIVLNANAKRTDLVSPESTFLCVKDINNKIIGVKGFQIRGDEYES